jgi:hypothetical protein
MQVDGAKIRHPTYHKSGEYLVLDSSGQIRNTYGYTAGLLPSLDGWELYQEPVEMFDGFEAYRRCFSSQMVRRKSWASGDFIFCATGGVTRKKNGSYYRLRECDATATDWMVVK